MLCCLKFLALRDKTYKIVKDTSSFEETKIPWSHNMLSENPNITYDDVKNNPNEPWDYSSLSKNPNITWDLVLENPDKNWCYNSLTRNPNITLEIVSLHETQPWNYGLLLIYSNVTWEIFMDNSDKFLNDYDGLSCNPIWTSELVPINHGDMICYLIINLEKNIQDISLYIYIKNTFIFYKK